MAIQSQEFGLWSEWNWKGNKCRRISLSISLIS